MDNNNTNHESKSSSNKRTVSLLNNSSLDENIKELINNHNKKQKNKRYRLKEWIESKMDILLDKRMITNNLNRRFSRVNGKARKWSLLRSKMNNGQLRSIDSHHSMNNNYNNNHQNEMKDSSLALLATVRSVSDTSTENYLSYLHRQQTVRGKRRQSQDILKIVREDSDDESSDNKSSSSSSSPTKIEPVKKLLLNESTSSSQNNNFNIDDNEEKIHKEKDDNIIDSEKPEKNNVNNLDVFQTRDRRKLIRGPSQMALKIDKAEERRRKSLSLINGADIEILNNKKSKNVKKVLPINIINNKKQENKKRRQSFNWSHEQEEVAIFNTDEWILFPNSFLRNFWDIIVVLMSLIVILLVPYSVSFESHSIDWKTLEIFIYIISILDIIICFRTAYRSETGDLIIDKIDIAYNYITNAFIFDFLGSGVLIWIFYHATNILSYRVDELIDAYQADPLHEKTLPFIYLTLLIKGIRLYRSDPFHYFFFSTDQRLSSWWRILKLFLAFCLLVHISGCFFFMIVRYLQNDTRYSWLDQLSINIQQNDLNIKDYYIHSIYVGMLMLIGENIEPINNNETLLSLFVMLTGGIFYATLFGQISLLIQNFKKSSSRYQEKMDEVNAYMKMQQLPEELKTRVRYFYEYMWTKHHIGANEQLDELSSSLKKEIFICKYLHYASQVTVFSDVAPDCLLHIIEKLTVEVFLPGDHVIRIGERGKEMFFISKGICEVSKDDQILATLDEGKYFGELAMVFKNVKRLAQVTAITYCDLAKLSKEDFEEVMNDHRPSAVKVVMKMKRNMIKYAQQKEEAHVNENENRRGKKVYQLSDFFQNILREERKRQGKYSLADIGRLIILKNRQKKK